MTLHHPTLLIASILMTVVMAITQLFYGFLTKGSTASRDMAIGTLLYALLCTYFLLEPLMPNWFRLAAVLLIGFKEFFIYRAIRSDLGLTPYDHIDWIFLLFAMSTASFIILNADFQTQQLLYTGVILYFFGKAFILAMRNRAEIPSKILLGILSFLICYPALFIVQALRFLFIAPTSELYSTEASSVVTTACLLILYTTANLAVHIIATIRSEKKQETLLSQTMDEKEFATGLIRIIGRDLSGFIGSISGAAEVIEDRDDPMISVIDANIRKARTVLTDLVYWGRSRDGISSENLDLVTASMMVNMIMEDITRDAEARGIKLTGQGSGDLISADSTAARVVLRNVCLNALKFTAKGGTVTIAARSGEGEIGISVSDQGPGMPSSQIEEIHSGRLLNSAVGTASKRDTSIGLKIANSVSEASGWKLEFDKKPGKGTTVTLWFPKVPD